MSVEKIYWDSDAFLAWFQEETDKIDEARGTLERALAGEVVIFTSTLTLAEVLWLRGAPKIPHEKAAIVRKFFRRSHFRLRNVTRSIAESAQNLVWFNAIKPKDAIHVATALDAGIPILETFDKDLIAQSGKVGTSSLIIRRPLRAKQPKFDLGMP